MKNSTKGSILMLSALLVFLSCKDTIKKELALNALFSDHMVLQQQDEVAFWGVYNRMEKVTVIGSWGEEEVTNSDSNGQWSLKLKTPKAGGPFEVRITTQDKTITLKDVLIGEVWLASGQSNMEMPLEGFLPNEPIDNYKEEIAAANYTNIRYIDVARAIESSPASSFAGQWQVTNPQNANRFSATAYFFARKLYQELGVPIGIITSTWGGTPVESWMSKEKIANLSEFSQELEALDEEKISVFNDWFAKFPTSEIPSTPEAWSDLNLDDEAFAQVDFDDSNWKSTQKLVAVEDLAVTSTDGAFWFRKKIMLDDISSDYTLDIAEGIDDMDETFVNGIKVGSTIGWNTPRSYSIPKSVLVKGENSIAIRIVDTGGGGGFMSEPWLTNNKTKAPISISENWLYSQTAGFRGANFLLFHKNEEALKNPPVGIDSYSLDSHTPTVLFNGMIQPLLPYNIQGAIWYQGESNVGRHEQYLKLFPGMIEDWRERWGTDFSFYFVQIAPFSYGNELSPALRDAQRKSLITPKTGMAITMDIGLPNSIHPGNKQDVGDRLAKLALANDYDKEIVASGPLYKTHSISGNKIFIEFDHIGTGLMSKSSGLLGFEIAGSNKEFIPAKATQIGNAIEVTTLEISEPKYVRYAWKDYIAGTLYNKEGLPASSFTTE
ncbi:MAG: sialate O-acetylesterase [Maribacter sp.]|uniref:sialate O-acetylesterase n=1 Tax=Maribacter sp. TaxID=1897614 RepID=UPI0032997BA6